MPAIWAASSLPGVSRSIRCNRWSSSAEPRQEGTNTTRCGWSSTVSKVANVQLS
ncbi:hypothetical protein QFZ75_002087 [Streptomyces sp. V3I8]|uniref:hypothetical protein n=1 Tax=Streptomyces sp. V3I8 TaxID=3042279 RepID=UPI0027830CB3|nr:hypothetical protein [Streptomyces sp. V3I8]MDQ1035671.1 hypothetical protein [Streptomyces sp. V3I8]